MRYNSSSSSVFHRLVACRLIFIDTSSSSLLEQVLFKIVSGKYDNLAAPMLPRPHSYVTRGHDLRLQKNRARYDLRKFFFTNRVVNIWNSLPDYVVHADAVNCFKSWLDTFWSNQDLVYNFKTEISGTGSRSEVV